jgi:Fe-S-cluster-containing dehydrogenase component
MTSFATKDPVDDKAGLSRRKFLTDAGLVIGGVATLSTMVACSGEGNKLAFPLSIPASSGYLLVDHIKCAGCLTCMMACSLVNEGTVNPSLSRIQIVQSSFAVFPNDVRQYQCRQCQTPVCVTNCPTGAAYIDIEHGNVRVINQDKCTGCMRCIEGCPQQPHRTIYNPVTGTACKCDLCLNAKYLGAAGGPGGKQACVASCPMQAIQYTDEMPDQTGDVGYDINLRNENAVLIQISEVPVPLESE